MQNHVLQSAKCRQYQLHEKCKQDAKKKQKDIAEQYGISQGRVSQIAKEQGHR